MEYQEIVNLFNTGSNQPSKFRTRYWVKINDESKEHIMIVILNLKL